MAMDAFRAAAPSASLAVRLSCGTDDSFATIWPKFVPRLVSALDLLPTEVLDSLTSVVDRVEDILELDEVTPDRVSRALHLLGQSLPLLVVVDEFDRIGDVGSSELCSDLVKTLSDDLVRCTLLLVGVADNVDELGEALRRALEEAQQSIRAAYTHAVSSPKKNATFGDTLLASALCASRRSWILCPCRCRSSAEPTLRTQARHTELPDASAALLRPRGRCL